MIRRILIVVLLVGASALAALALASCVTPIWKGYVADHDGRMNRGSFGFHDGNFAVYINRSTHHTKAVPQITQVVLYEALGFHFPIEDFSPFSGIDEEGNHLYFPYVRFTLVVIPAWALIVMLLIYPLIAFISGPVRRHRRNIRGLCISCGYDLRGSESGICPECGSHHGGQVSGNWNAYTVGRTTMPQQHNSYTASPGWNRAAGCGMLGYVLLNRAHILFALHLVPRQHDGSLSLVVGLVIWVGFTALAVLAGIKMLGGRWLLFGLGLLVFFALAWGVTLSLRLALAQELPFALTAMQVLIAAWLTIAIVLVGVAYRRNVNRM